MILETIGIFLIIVGLLILFTTSFLARFNNNFPKTKRKELTDFCVLIPARDESKVIEDLLISIKNQTKKIDMKDVYIIVENKLDPTIEIAKKYNATIFIRKKLDLKRKGYALDECIKDLEAKKIYYNAYFIFDADNVLDEHFFSEMEKSYQAGYDIAIGYRNLKNGNDSIISACSGITFAFLNSNGNETKSRQSRNITLSGTGLYIDGELIKKWKSFPFHSLTEDYELTLYSIKNNLTSIYNKNAIFYDEQPIKYKNTINQRTRWIKGYFTTRKEYVPGFRKLLKNNPNFGSVINEISGMKPYIIMIIGALLYILNQIITLFKVHNLSNPLTKLCFTKIVLIIMLAYILFAFMTAYIILKDKDKINMSMDMQIKTILFSPLFFATYVPCALKAFLKKEVKWEKVEHTRRWK